MITLEPKVYLFFSKSFKILIKNLVAERLAWVLARGARKGRKLLARRENLLVPDDRTGFSSSPAAGEMPMDTFFSTYQLFLNYGYEIFILGVPGFSKTTQTYLKIPEDVLKLPKTHSCTATLLSFWSAPRIATSG